MRIVANTRCLDFASGLADEYCVRDSGGMALTGSTEALDRGAVHKLLAL